MFSFKKSERLKKQKDIDTLFKTGHKVKEHPVLLLWSKRENDDNVPLKMAFSVPKKLIKSAVKRNRIKRQMREIYRLQKNTIYNHLKNSPVKYAGMLIYVSEDLPDFELLKEKIIVILDRYRSTVESNIN